MVFGWDDKLRRAIYLRPPKTKHKKTMQMFYYDNHYSTVKSISAIMKPYFHDNTEYFCPYCTFRRRTANAVQRHMEDCKMDKITVEKMPKEGSFVKFNNDREIVFKPFMIWADYECRTEKVNVRKGNKTKLIQNHKPSGYCLHLVSRVDSFDDRTLNYTAKTNDDNVSEHFLRTLVNLVKKIGNKYTVDKPLTLTEEEQFEFDNATVCWICKERFDDDHDDDDQKVRDHCHYTGKYRGPAHNSCNLKLRKDKVITVGFHNGTNYDFHLFVRDL